MNTKPYSFSVNAVMRDEAGRWLLLRRAADSKTNPSLWDLPGGKLEPGENPEVALLREIWEEAGLSARLICVAGATEWEMAERRIACLIFEATTDDSLITLSSEHDKAMWVSPERLGEYEVCHQFREFLQQRIQAAAQNKVGKP